LRRLIEHGGVKIDGKTKLTDPAQQDAVPEGAVVRVGKRRWFRVTFHASV